ncbi:hypothetical protein WA158_007682 [Blastocystis sp. Blastoise]
MNKLELITVIIDVSKQYEKGFAIRDCIIHYTDNFITKQPSNYPKYIYSNLYSKEDRVETVCDKVNDYGDNNIRAFVAISHVKGGYALSSIEEYIDFETNNGLWVFINKHLFLDYGGYNTPVGSHINITNYADKLGLIPGITYSISIFFASRTCGTQSRYIRCIIPTVFKYTNVTIVSLSLLQYICTAILLTNKDIDIFYEAAHNNRIYESIQATTIICQLLPLFPNQQREYLQSLLLNTCDNICTVQSIKKTVDFLTTWFKNAIYLNDGYKSFFNLLYTFEPSLKSISVIYLTISFLTIILYHIIIYNTKKRNNISKSIYIYESNSIPQDIMYTLLTRIAEIIQIARCPSSYILPKLHTLKKIDIYSISFNMSHNSLEVYSPPFPPPPLTNYFTGAYKDIENDLMDDDDMEVPEEEEIGLMNTYEEKERGEGEEKPIGELIYELSYILNTVEIEGKREEENDHSIDVQYVYSLLRNQLKATNKEDRYDMKTLGEFICESFFIYLYVACCLYKSIIAGNTYSQEYFNYIDIRHTTNKAYYILMNYRYINIYTATYLL